MAWQSRRQRRERKGRFDGIWDVLEILFELLVWAPRLIFGFFRIILKIFD